MLSNDYTVFRGTTGFSECSSNAVFQSAIISFNAEKNRTSRTVYVIEVPQIIFGLT